MQKTPCVQDMPSLDEVVHQAMQHGSGLCLSPPSTPAATRTALSRLADAKAGFTPQLTQTPTVQALHELCHAFVGRYRSPDALLLDTAWWVNEAARMREAGDLLNMAAPTKFPPPSSSPTPAERDDLRQHTTQLVHVTHSSNMPADLHSVVTGDMQRTAFSSPLASAPPPPQLPPQGKDAAEANVLRLDEPTAGPENTWGSLEFGSGTAIQQSGEVRGRLRRDEECLRVLDTWIVSSTTHTSQADTECVESLAYLLHHRPELVTRHTELNALLRLVVASTCRTPTDRWATSAFTLFQALPARSQLDFLHALVSSLRDEEPSAVQGDARLATFVQHLLREFPESWISVLDSEVTDIFFLVVAHVIVPFASVFDQVDPAAAWLAQWGTRPSFPLAIHALLQEHPDVVAKLRKETNVSSHAACVLLHLLPYMSAQTEDTTSAAYSLNGTALGGTDETPAQKLRWVVLFCDLQQLLTDRTRLLPPAVYELGRCSLGSCAPQLPSPQKEQCTIRLLDALHQWMPAGNAARTAAPSLRDGAYVFAFQLVTDLVLADERETEAWSTVAMWDALDERLHTQLTSTAAETSNAASHHPKAPPLGVSHDTPVSGLQQCLSRLLGRHASRLPRTLAALMENVLTLSLSASRRLSRASLAWDTLVAVSSTMSGWTALQPYLARLSGTLKSSSSRQWMGLLQAIVATADCTFPSPPSLAAHARLTGPTPPEAATFSHLSSVPPRCIALLLRWSTVAEARDGLTSAAREATLFFFQRTQRAVKAGGHAGAARGEKDGGARASPRWPLLWPVEAYPRIGSADLSSVEDSAAAARNVRSLACYQSLALLLSCTALPPLSEAAPGTANIHEPLDDVWGQLEDLWLLPAQLLHEDGTGGVAGEPTPPPTCTSPTATTTAAAVVNHLPFEEDSLLTLLCSLAVCILVRSSAEYAAWLRSDVVQQRLRPLRRFCVARCGVDLVYFMVRYITSGKGRKRLPAILLDGGEADLTVDSVIDVRDFTDGEDLPSGELALPVTDAEVVEVLRASVPPTSLSTDMDRHGRSRSSSSNNSGKSISSWPPGLVALTRMVLAHQKALRTTPAAVQLLLSSRSAEEWEAFAQHEARSLAVGRILEASHPAASAILRSAHVDVFYLASLCVLSWIWLPATHVTSARRKLFWAAMLYFSQHGVAAYDDYVAQSLAAHVERLQRENISCVNEAVLLPQQRPLPLPSALFVLLLVKPFSLAPP